jgi:hypothetical protein
VTIYDFELTDLLHVEEDIRTMGIRGWRKLSKERTEWKKITEKAKNP